MFSSNNSLRMPFSSRPNSLQIFITFRFTSSTLASIQGGRGEIESLSPQQLLPLVSQITRIIYHPRPQYWIRTSTVLFNLAIIKSEFANGYDNGNREADKSRRTLMVHKYMLMKQVNYEASRYLNQLNCFATIFKSC
jgi:hypothetical protein